jgi:hypothetical protein
MEITVRYTVPCENILKDTYFQHLVPGESRGTYFLARIPNGSLFLATNSQNNMVPLSLP